MPGRAVRVSVPATSANLGPGFDSFGLALGLRDTLVARVLPAGLSIAVVGEDDGGRGPDNLVARAVAAGLASRGASAAGLSLTCDNRIPHGRGLGSSAAAVVAGAVAGISLAGAEPSPEEILRVAYELEGHPDNVAAALVGGFTLAWLDGAGHPHVVRAEPPAELRPVLFVPENRQLTREARAALPARVPHADAARGAGRAGLLALLMAEGTARRDLGQLLMAATEDSLHQPYRLPSMPASAALVTALRDTGVPAVLSGSGPTVLAFATSAETVEAALGAPAAGFETRMPEVDLAGATVQDLVVDVTTAS